MIGLAFDGTGYGTDGAVWGGEILIVEEHDFRRAGHLAYVAMPGSTAAMPITGTTSACPRPPA